MAKCSECHEAGHTSKKHEVRCLICGQTKKFPIEEVKEAKQVFKCGDVEAHEKARNIWNLDYTAAQRVKAYGIHERGTGKEH